MKVRQLKSRFFSRLEFNYKEKEIWLPKEHFPGGVWIRQGTCTLGAEDGSRPTIPGRLPKRNKLR